MTTHRFRHTGRPSDTKRIAKKIAKGVAGHGKGLGIERELAEVLEKDVTKIIDKEVKNHQ